MTAFSLDPDTDRTGARELRALAAERLRPLAEKGEPGRVNRPLRRRTGRTRPAGAAVHLRRALDLCLLRESLAYACTEAETALALQGLGAYPVRAARARRRAARALAAPRCVAGRAVAAFALSEPGAGSDAAALALARASPTAPAAGGSPARSAGSPTPPRPTSTPSSPAPAEGAGARGRHRLPRPRRPPRTHRQRPSTCSPRTPSAPSPSTASR